MARYMHDMPGRPAKGVFGGTLPTYFAPDIPLDGWMPKNKMFRLHARIWRAGAKLSAPSEIHSRRVRIGKRLKGDPP